MRVYYHCNCLKTTSHIVRLVFFMPFGYASRSIMYLAKCVLSSSRNWNKICGTFGIYFAHKSEYRKIIIQTPFRSVSWVFLAPEKCNSLCRYAYYIIVVNCNNSLSSRSKGEKKLLIKFRTLKGDKTPELPTLEAILLRGLLFSSYKYVCECVCVCAYACMCVCVRVYVSIDYCNYKLLQLGKLKTTITQRR